VQNYTFYFEFDTRKRKKVAKSLEYQRIIPIFAASEMANPVFSVWSKTGPTLLRFLKGCLGNSLFVIQFRECCNEIPVSKSAASND
jgi:hypothetical protein